MKVSSGCSVIDKLLRGGFEEGVISTLYGSAGSGKTNLAILVAMSSAEKDKVVFVDSVLPEQPVLIRQKGKMKMVKIGELADGYFDEDEQGSKGVNNLYCLSMKKDGQVRWSKVKRVYRHWNADPKYRFVLKNGLLVETTSAHSIITVRNRGKKFKVKLSKDVSLNDRFVVPFRLSKGYDQDLKTLNVAEHINEKKALSGRRTTVRKKLGLIKLTDSFVRFLGWYLAEGYVCFKKGEGLTRLYLNKEKDKEALEVVEFVSNQLGLRCDVYERDKDCMIGISSMSLALLMKRLFKGTGARKKRVPDIVYNMSKRQKEIFLDAWIKGDYGSSVSQELISDICYLGFMIGKRYSIYELKRKGIIKIGDREISLNNMYVIAGNKKALREGLIRQRRIRDTMLLKIKRIEQFERPCMVYDLCVDGDETFVAGFGGIVLHNTEGGFSTERVEQLFPEANLKNVKILEPTTFEEQSKAVDEIKKLGAKLVVIDSIVMLYRLGLKENNISETNKELARQLSVLSELARKNKIAIIVTNQVYSDFEKRDAVKMVGGDLLKYWSKCIIKLEKVGESIRKASLVKHRSLAEGSSTFFEICENEIREAKEPKRKFSLF